MNLCFDYDFVMFVPLCGCNVLVCGVDVVRGVIERGGARIFPIPYMICVVICALRW